MKYALAIIFLICAIFIWGFYLPKDSNSQTMSYFSVKKGEGIYEVGKNLKSQGLVNSTILFDLYVLGGANAKNLKAGDYEVSPSMSVAKIADMIIEGRTAKKVITIIEGWTVEDIQQYFKEKNIEGSVNKEEEGYLFPDTYEINPQDKAEDVVTAMEENFDTKLSQDLRNEIVKQKKTVSEIIIMASLIEKEVRNYADMQMVSGILWKRIDNKMPLQVDSAKETYQYKGLPASPICNPGLDSIKAAIYPTKSVYWFYISTPSGQTILSKTLAEHNAAIKKYLK
jgi:UPF0755 protein